LGADGGAAAHFVAGGPALDLTGDLNLFGALVSAQVWDQFQTQSLYAQGTLGMNVSPVPMIALAPALGVVALNSAFGPVITLTGTYSPFLLPVTLEATAGAAYLNGGPLLPYSVGVKAGIFPLTSLAIRYRGWAGSGPLSGLGGPELGIVIGL
jgi:hypothetical protein